MSVTSVPGFVASGVASGIKSSGDQDLAIIATEDNQPVTTAGIFTQNSLIAAPVVVSKTHLLATKGQAVAVVVNSGNANAATGNQGLADAEKMCAETASKLGVTTEQVLVCSTGTIGFNLPMVNITDGIADAAASLSADGGEQAATAMMTTDTVAKFTSVTHVDSAGVSFTVGGIAKGAAMLEPNMATMLAVITTDAQLGPAEATLMLQHGAGPAFNSLTVDGAQSTNDTVLMMANGRAGRVEPDSLQAAIDEVLMTLAVKMADDAEGSTKTVFVDVVNAADQRDADAVARGIANSQLIKCSWYGQDAYWGRIASETGVQAAQFNAETVTIKYGDQTVSSGCLPAEPDPARIKEIMAQRRIVLTVDLGQGNAHTRVITTDLAPGYIEENKGTS